MNPPATRAIHDPAHDHPMLRAGAYTLMEMLVVIGIIAVLAALTLTIIPIATEKRARALAQAQRTALVNAIEGYKVDLNEYPPDNTKSPEGPSRPPLFYELTGVSFNQNSKEYRSAVSGQPPMPAASLPFSQQGFRNCASDGSAGKNYYPELKSKQYDKDPSGGYADYYFLTIPVRGPGGDFNPWHYVSTKPTNNPNSFDLWINIVPRDKTVRIDNWSN